MKAVWNTCKRELGGMKCVNDMKTTTKKSLENFQKQLPFRETYVKYVEKNYIIMALLHSFL